MPSKARPNSIKSCRDNYSVLFLKEDVLQTQIHYTQKFASCSSRSTRSLRVNTAAFFAIFQFFRKTKPQVISQRKNKLI